MTAGERLAVGQVRGFHGLRGTLRVESLSDRAEERFEVGRALYVEGRETKLTIVESTPDALGWRLRFTEVPDRNAAEALRDVYLEAVVAQGATPSDTVSRLLQNAGILPKVARKVSPAPAAK